MRDASAFLTDSSTILSRNEKEIKILAIGNILRIFLYASTRPKFIATAAGTAKNFLKQKTGAFRAGMFIFVNQYSS